MRTDYVLAVVDLCRRSRRMESDPDTDLDAMMATGREVEALAQDAWRRPVASFDDVLARALLARDFADKAEDGLTLLPGATAQERAAIALIDSVLALAERMGLDV